MNKKEFGEMADCVGCGLPATKYCDGWNHSSSKSSKFGDFEFSSQCGYPVCDSCVHDSTGEHKARDNEQSATTERS
jgi:hypothetical protein